jgi:adenine-specific DNA-methyltransferase
MARSKGRRKEETRVDDYRHDNQRLNNPPIGLTGYEPQVSEPEIKTYAYDPHLSPQLVWAGKPGLEEIKVSDRAGVDVETLPLHIHERVSTRAIIDAVKRPEPKQLGLFADPQLPLGQAVEFYQHDTDWANRLILGDSLVVMNSLAERELMAGKVQMIFIDPPYGVKYASNFQPRIDQREVKEDDDYLTREPETIKAYRDTWTLGVHSYLTYLRDRLRVARELLTDSGSIFVQIGNENVHLVRCLMDEVFGAENFCSMTAFRKTGGLQSRLLASVTDYLLWYAKDRKAIKFRRLYIEKSPGETGATQYRYRLSADGKLQSLTPRELIAADPAEVLTHDNLTSQGNPRIAFQFDGREFADRYKTTVKGLERLAAASRLLRIGNTLRYVRKLSDSPYTPINEFWHDTGISGFEEEKRFVVQTSPDVIARCTLMTTDPGDLVLDPTCGSGTTAYVAERWGRRWITIDTSRVALALARQRILTATYPYYKLADPDQGIDGGFEYKMVPHITLKSIAQNTRIDPVTERYAPLIEEAENAGDEERVRQLKLERKREIDQIIAEDAEQEILFDDPDKDERVVRVSGPFTVEAIPPAAMTLDEDSPIGGAPEPDEQLDEITDVDPTAANGADDPAAYIARMIELLRKDGVTFPGNKRLTFDELRPLNAGVLHAEGEPADDPSLNRVAISFGPQYGAISPRQVEEGFRYANLGGYDGIIFAGFSFQAEAQQAITDVQHPNVKAFMSQIRPDVIMTDARGESLLKTMKDSQLFTVFGEPDVELHADDDDTYRVTLNGVDVYDPLTGEVQSASGDRIAAWFLDTDYDRRTFAICQAFFPDKSKWKNLQRALKSTIDDEVFDQLTSRESLPFKAEDHRRVAVKVIDQRGNEVMRVIPLDQLTEYAN